ncbi:MAG TPA: type I DNA topoisomerase [Candidatus Kapabacteria bacterium]|nr:type I DNA topoisomerase [Candidatus Kapabacteria bacterium]
MKTLVIVESPTKAKTISKFLGKGFTVESSFGHVRDLPKSKMGVDTEHGTFEPQYLIPKDKAEHVKKLKKIAKGVDNIIFATDEDREGEAISWHLAQILDIDITAAKRMVFHEITKHAIDEALQHPRAIDQKLVDAQQARRVLDRLVGYELSPLLWNKVARGLSAGRVQSVAVRLIVEREREIQAFKTEEYWTIAGLFSPPSSQLLFPATLHSIDGKRIQKLDIKKKEQADAIVADLHDASYTVAKVTKKETKRLPPPPFTTSTLQQQANHKLGMSAKQTMRIAQQLYEGIELGEEGSVGLITYMRTDSYFLSQKFLGETRAHIQSAYGATYDVEKPRLYATKSKGAQEAHEAIRPTDPTRTPDAVKPYLAPQQYKLYTLIWKRAVATQMAAARLDKTTMDITAKQYSFRASGQTMLFDGWLKLYPETTGEELLPEVKEGEHVTCKEIKPEQHFTEPPARYSDATLVKAMEEYGIGRPSTYAPTIATIEDRKYVERDEQKRLKPTDIALVVNDLLVNHFSNIVDYQFTAEMEKNLDKIAEGKKEWQPVIAAFYHPFHETIEHKNKELNKKELTEEKTDETCPNCNSPMVIKVGRFGKFMACSNYPTCKTTKPIGDEAKQMEELSGEVCEKCGKPMAVKRGRFGMFLGCSGYPDCKNIKRIEKKTGVTCQKCGQGEFVERKSKRGKPFYGCNRYPECDNVLWSKPTGELCPTCKSPVVFGAKKTVRCSNKECDYTKALEPETTEE